MAGRLQDKVAIVTGAGSILPGWGNGKATAVLFAREGPKAVLVDSRADAVEETATIIRTEGGTCEPVVCDVSVADQVQTMVERAGEVLGGRIDVLHNNVGIAVMGDAVTLSEAESIGQAHADRLSGGDRDEMRRHRAALVPMGRMDDAWDVAHAAPFLASEEARYIAGAELVVDGGLVCKVA